MDLPKKTSLPPPAFVSRDSGKDDEEKQEEILPDYKDQVRNARPSAVQRTNDSADPGLLRQSEKGPTYKDQVRSSNRRSQQAPNEGPEGLPTFKGQAQSVAPPPSSGRSDGARLNQRVPEGLPTFKGQAQSVAPPPSSGRSDGAQLNQRVQRRDAVQSTNTTNTFTQNPPTARSSPAQQEGELVNAVKVDSGIAIQATPVNVIKRRRLAAAAAFLAIVVATAVVVAVVLTQQDRDTDSAAQQGKTAPTGSPSPSPTDLPLQWFLLGENVDEGSEDGDLAGTSVATSRNGLSLALGSPGGEAVTIYTYTDNKWDIVDVIEGVLRYDDEAVGQSVALNDSGSIVAIGIPFAVPEDPEAVQIAAATPGRVRVYEYTDGSYQQLGSDIVGTEPGGEFGWSVGMSDDGKIIIVGSRKHCTVRVIRFSAALDDWIGFGKEGIGCPLGGDNYDSSFGTSVSLNSKGSIAAIGEPARFNNEDEITEGDISGRVRLYEYFDETDSDSGLGSWMQLGKTLEGEAVADAFGTSLALSDNGMILAVGAPFNDGGQKPIEAIDREIDPAVGSCRVFEYNRTSELWQQLGDGIFGEEPQEHSGTSVSLSSDGKTLACGAVGSNLNGGSSGAVRVFEYASNETGWSQVGQTIAGPFPSAESGASVALSAYGDVVVVGATNAKSPDKDLKGSAQVYELGVLEQGGDFPIAIVIHSDKQPKEVGWQLDRLDIEGNVTFRVDGVPFGTYAAEQQTEVRTLMVASNGVYQFTIFDKGRDGICCWDGTGSYEIFLSANVSDTEQRVVRKFGNYSVYATHSFVARSLKDQTAPPAGTAFVTLAIDFDERPQEVHWVLLAIDTVVDPESKLPEEKETVLAFGPEQEYGQELAGSLYIEVIDVSSVSREDGTIKFILTDTGRNGLCCDNGFGSYTLYSGSSVGDDGSIFFSSNAKGKRREVNTFSLAATGGSTLAPSTKLPTVEPSADASTASPSSTADDAARATSIAAYINSISFAGLDIIYPPPLPQNATTEELAVQWLIEDDPLRLSADSPADHFRLQQRFALLTLLFQSDDDPLVDPWDDDLQLIEQECDWRGIWCVARYLGLDLDIQKVVDSIRIGEGTYSSFRFSRDMSLLPHLQEITVDFGDQLSDLSFSLPSWISTLESLTSLTVLPGSGLISTIPNTIGDLTRLSGLELGGNLLSGTLPPSLSRCTDMTRFVLEDNGLSGTLPDLLQWTSLDHFSIQNNIFSGPLPATSTWTNLGIYEVHNNTFAGTVPSVIGEWTKLWRFSLSHNPFLNGTLPQSIGAWTELDVFLVQETMLSGPLPTSIGEWTGLYTFWASDTMLSGNLPISIGEWTSLNEFFANDCLFSGSLPNSIGNWTWLSQFDASGNSFSSTLPHSIGRWNGLRLFNVFNNSFHGQIPQSVGNWSGLEQASFAYNNFTGTMPICADSSQLDFLIHLEADCAEVECPCCTLCF